MPFDFTGKKIVVVGASGGIGSATARLLSGSGADLLLCGRSRAGDVPEFRVGGQSSGSVTHHPSVSFDLSNESSTKEGIKAIRGIFPRIDGLVLSAGVPFGAPALLTRLRDFRDVLEVNTVSQFLVLQGLARSLNFGASCVVVGSATSSYFQPGNMVYAVSKAALDRMVLSFAGELAPLGVRVNAVVPGPVSTKMLESMDQPSLNRMMDSAFRNSPTDPEQIAKVIAFLLSTESEALVGAVVKLDGGLA